MLMTHARIAALSLATASCAVPAAAGEITIAPLVLEGDAVPEVGLITRIDNIAVNRSGTWLVEADTDNPDTDADTVLLRDGVLMLREGESLPAPIGASIDSFDSIVINDAGASAWNFFLSGTKSTSDDSGIYNGIELVVQEGDETFIEGLSEGTIYLGFFDVKINDSMQWISVLSIDDPEIPGSVNRAIILFEDVRMGVTRTLIAKESDLLPGMTEQVADFGTGPHHSAFADGGEIMYFADLAGDTAVDGTIWLWDGKAHNLVAREGSPSPVKGRTWFSLASPELDINNTGGHVYSGRLDGDTATDMVIIRDGAVFKQEGDPAPGANDFQLTGFGTGPLEISDAGEVLWYGAWNDPDGDVDSGLHIDDELLVQEGVTEIAGSVVDTIRGVQDGYHMSDDGRYVIFEAILLDGREGAFLIDRGAPCPGDIDGSGEVDVNDILALLSGWGDCPTGEPCPADLDGDGTVGVNDLLLALGGWGPCP